MKSWSSFQVLTEVKPTFELKGGLIDTAGTIVDPGSKAPCIIFQKAFAKKNILVNEKEIKKDMGIHKKEHIQKLLKMPAIHTQWKNYYKREPLAFDIEDIFKTFEQLQENILPNYSVPIPHSLQTLQYLHSFFHLKFIANSGYTRSMLNNIFYELEKNHIKYPLEATIAVDELERGRPYPDGCWKAQDMLNIEHPWEMVKIGDTKADIQEGKNAEFWTIGLVKYSNEVGLNEQEIINMEKNKPNQLMELYYKAGKTLWEASPDYVAFDIGFLPMIFHDINKKLKKGFFPKNGSFTL
jgi:phosphonoacetaldehyde hydrolase